MTSNIEPIEYIEIKFILQQYIFNIIKAKLLRHMEKSNVDLKNIYSELDNKTSEAINKIAILSCPKLNSCKHRNKNGSFCGKPISDTSNNFCKSHLEKTISSIIEALVQKKEKLPAKRFKISKEEEGKYGPLYNVLDTKIIINRSGIAVASCLSNDLIPLTKDDMEECKRKNIMYNAPIYTNDFDEKKMNEELQNYKKKIDNKLEPIKDEVEDDDEEI